MPVINPYLTCAGNAEEVFNFYKSVFGGEFLTVMRFKDVPSEYDMPADEGEKIMYIALPIGGNIIMGGDASSKPLVTGNNITISLTPETREEADKLYNALAEGGIKEVPMSEAFWGDYFGMFTDKFGIQWLINCTAK